MDVAHERLILKELRRLKSLEKAASDPYLTPTKPLIQRATQILRFKFDFDQYFQPIFVAFGPLHHPKDDDSRLYKAEDSKLQLAAKFIKGSGRTNEEFYKNVKGHLSSLKKCYEQRELDKWKENWDDEDLAWMFLVDGCALLQFIFLDVENKWEEFGGKDNEIVFAKLDIFLLENQLPYQLLQMLIASCIPSKGGGPNPQKELRDCITKFINKNFFSQDYSQHLSEAYQILVDPPKEPAHLLELLRTAQIEDKAEKDENEKQGIFGGTHFAA